MIQSIMVACVVLICALYWTGRMFPRIGMAGWRLLATVLRGMGAPAGWTRIATRRALPRAKGGCGGCAGCADTRTGCQPGQK
ncbi:DUF6587 family protein [Novacetimonas pomaceti]|uniref:Uncharacterized protein n=1 Tax=Novacetimonas pomaceti TaxID=2021998 RepID=A0A318QEE8_9PROT|nr:DUF6587 family protein [Novacetimonas pomaceti]PYD46929.1 hypothetical protein C3920_12615 [Novacetimonas pomaceti]PYD76244.1 hypothetical protein CFR71_05210 [Novacetimonas pomaceti]